MSIWDDDDWEREPRLDVQLAVLAFAIIATWVLIGVIW